MPKHAKNKSRAGMHAARRVGWVHHRLQHSRSCAASKHRHGAVSEQRGGNGAAASHDVDCCGSQASHQCPRAVAAAPSDDRAITKQRQRKAVASSNSTHAEQRGRRRCRVIAVDAPSKHAAVCSERQAVARAGRHGDNVASRRCLALPRLVSAEALHAAVNQQRKQMCLPRRQCHGGRRQRQRAVWQAVAPSHHGAGCSERSGEVGTGGHGGYRYAAQRRRNSHLARRGVAPGEHGAVGEEREGVNCAASHARDAALHKEGHCADARRGCIRSHSPALDIAADGGKCIDQRRSGGRRRRNAVRIGHGKHGCGNARAGDGGRKLVAVQARRR